MSEGPSGAAPKVKNEVAASPRVHALAFGIFLLLAWIALLPGSLHPGAALLGSAGDNFQHAWFLWHFAEAIAHGQNPFYTNLIFYPHRVNLAWSTTVPIVSAFALPLSLTAGPIVAYNLSLTLQIALSGFFAYLLCLRICRNVSAAIIGGACFGLSPFLMGEALGHLSLVTAFPIPLYFLALDTLLRRADPRWPAGIATGLALFLTSLAHYNYTVFCILLTVVICCVDMALEGTQLFTRIWKPLAAAAATFALLFLPLFLMLWRNPAGRPQSRDVSLIETHSADALAWLVPSWNHVLFGRFARNWNANLFTAGYEGVAYLGPVILPLAVLGYSAFRRTNRCWAVRLATVALIFWTLSLGPHIRIWGHATRIPGPAHLFYASPFARFVSAPARFDVVAMLAAAGLAAMGAAYLFERFPARRAMIAAILCALLAIDLLPLPFPVSTSATSVRIKGFGIPIDGCTLPTDVSNHTIVTVPMLQWPFPVRAMWMQLNDGGRYALADGYVSYAPNEIFDKFWDVSLLRSLRAVQAGNGPSVNLATARADLPAAISEMNLGAFVVYDFPQRDATLEYLQQVLSVEAARQPTCTIFDLHTQVNALAPQPPDSTPHAVKYGHSP